MERVGNIITRPNRTKDHLVRTTGRFVSRKTGFLLILTAIALAGCSNEAALSSATTAEQAAGAASKPVKTAAVATQAWAGAKTLTADVIPSLELNVMLKVDGDVKSVLKKRGDQVQKDDVIIELDKKDLLRQKQKLLYARASLEEQMTKAKKDWDDGILELTNNMAITQQSLDDVTKQYNRVLNDYDTGQATKDQKEQLESQVKQLQLNLQTLKQKLQTLQSTKPLAAIEYQLQANDIDLQDADVNLSYFEVKAPASGLLTEMPIEEGMTLARGQKIGVVQQQAPIKIRAEVTEADLPLVQGKQSLSFHNSDSPDTYEGKVTYLANTANTQTKTYSLELEAANANGRLKPGMRVQLLLAGGGEQQVISVPADSILREDGEPYVFILNGDHAEKRTVKLGRSKDAMTEITQGLKAGELLIVSGQYQLKHMEKVAPGQ
ncbi:efflux RND transporter periplasmic adaptor subunit [Paenibacillus alba]|uniref:efflux RND transporter periplasmic adaptor subunit n=1 Tax=Paenibacillus alba TaxID=1197127 RepID=UPI001564F2AB|nr:efflux RND transporter periplasmic adaptor subunit [Paenibacillus alba]NQX66560.1 efflux RND transporter periplasmic adaptor subunit [Paenibacillus alba]